MQQQLKKICTLIATASLSMCAICSSQAANTTSMHNIPLEGTTTPAPSSASSSQHSSWNPQPVQQALYVNANLGAGESSDSPIGFAFGAATGYQFNSNVAAEFNFLRLPFNNDKSNYLFGGNAVISLPLGTPLRAFGKIGLAGMKSPDKTRLALLLGGGVEYSTTQSIILSAQMLGTVGANQAQSLSILGGIGYRFGGMG